MSGVQIPGPEPTKASQKSDPETGKARVFFRFDNRQFNRTARAKSERAAEALSETIDQTIADLERGRLALPSESDIAAFLISGGTVVKSVARSAPPKCSAPLGSDRCIMNLEIGRETHTHEEATPIHG